MKRKNKYIVIKGNDLHWKVNESVPKCIRFKSYRNYGLVNPLYYSLKELALISQQSFKVNNESLVVTNGFIIKIYDDENHNEMFLTFIHDFYVQDKS